MKPSHAIWLARFCPSGGGAVRKKRSDGAAEGAETGRASVESPSRRRACWATAGAGSSHLPVLAAYEQGTEEERQFWKRVIEENEQTEADLPHALEIIARRDAIRITIERARDYAEKAVAALACFPESGLKNLLRETVLYTVERAR